VSGCLWLCEELCFFGFAVSPLQVFCCCVWIADCFFCFFFVNCACWSVIPHPSVTKCLASRRLHAFDCACNIDALAGWRATPGTQGLVDQEHRTRAQHLKAAAALVYTNLKHAIGATPEIAATDPKWVGGCNRPLNGCQNRHTRVCFWQPFVRSTRVPFDASQLGVQRMVDILFSRH